MVYKLNSTIFFSKQIYRYLLEMCLGSTCCVHKQDFFIVGIYNYQNKKATTLLYINMWSANLIQPLFVKKKSTWGVLEVYLRCTYTWFNEFFIFGAYSYQNNKPTTLLYINVFCKHDSTIIKLNKRFILLEVYLSCTYTWFNKFF